MRLRSAAGGSAAGAAAAPRRMGPTRPALALRGLVATVVIVVGLTAAVAYGGGYFSSSPEVSAVVPARAGTITGTVGVQYKGVRVGEVSSIDAGTRSSVVHMRIDGDAMDRIPANVLVRIVPRTLFGDVLLSLVPGDGAGGDGGAGAGHLRPGQRLRTDTSPDAAVLYDVYEDAVSLMDELRPGVLQTSLTAAADALRGRGADLGRSIDRLAAASNLLTPSMVDLLGHAPQLAAAAEAARAAAPDALGAVRDTTGLSMMVLDRPGSLAEFFGAGEDAARTVDSVGAGWEGRVERVIRQSEPLLAAAAQERGGMVSTLDAMRRFAAEGKGVFANGVFNITAVPGFADPMPYTPADCPRYGALAGPNCAGGGGR